MVSIASFKVIGELQRERLRHSCATAFSLQREWSVAGIFYTGEVRADFMRISKFPEILGKLSMCKQYVQVSFLPAHAQDWERG